MTDGRTDGRNALTVRVYGVFSGGHLFIRGGEIPAKLLMQRHQSAKQATSGGCFMPHVPVMGAQALNNVTNDRKKKKKRAKT